MLYTIFITCKWHEDSTEELQPSDLHVIERKLNSDFDNLYEWFIDNKLSIHFGEDKTQR